MTRVREMAGPFPPMDACDHCSRVVPIAPGQYRASVPHVVSHVLAPDQVEVSICAGNRKRALLDAVRSPALRLAEQYARMQDDDAWDL